MPAVVLKTSFVYEWDCGGFLDYMERPRAFKGKLSAISQEFYDYFNYMSNEDKTDGLFSAEKDILDENDVASLRRREKASQDEGCPKYLGVISFDNDFLKENGWIVGDKIDLEKIKSVTRKSVANMIDTSDKLDKDNVYWTAAIHLNTDNVHIHFQLLENHRKEDRKITQKRNGQDCLENEAFEKLKSTVVSEMLTQKRTPMLTRIKREILIPEVSKNITAASSLNTLLHELPPTQKAWQYNRRAIRPFHERINMCIDEIIESDEELSENFEKFKKELESVSRQYGDIYGNRKNPEIANYAQNQMDDFYARAGNALLQELFILKNTEKIDLNADVKVTEIARAESEQSENFAPVLLKKKFFKLRKEIEEEEKPIVRDEKVGQMEKLANEDNASIAVSYLAFFFYKHRKEKEEYEEKAEKYLQKSMENENSASGGSAAYLLGKLYLEQGKKEDGIEMIKYAANKDVPYAQFAYGKIALQSGKYNTAEKYLKQSAENGVEAAKKYLNQNRSSNQPASALKNAMSGASLRNKFAQGVRISVYNSQIISNRCANAIKKLLNESDAHLKKLVSEFEYEQQQAANNRYLEVEREY